MKIPCHVAVIMDGNGRWAERRGLPRIAGHHEGAKRIKEIVRESKALGIKVLTIFAFSTENWDRPKKEIDFLFKYLEDFIKNYRDELMREEIKVNFIGRRDRIKTSIIAKMQELEAVTCSNGAFVFNIALDYGGRWDILQAAQKLLGDCQSGKISVEAINEDIFKNYLAINGLPDPDLLIRTSGEERISNFLLWNLAYAELYFTQVYWPDFNKEELKKAVEVYSDRERRFGQIYG
ncbi:MAG: isoprenyl transferase [Candidatus Omnitrophota bacterium]